MPTLLPRRDTRARDMQARQLRGQDVMVIGTRAHSASSPWAEKEASVTSNSDDSIWLSTSDELGDEWVEDDTKGTLHWEAARHRLRQAGTATDGEPVAASSSLPHPRTRDDSSHPEQ